MSHVLSRVGLIIAGSGSIRVREEGILIIGSENG
jgi:hypothetical protein